jgi:hypothetical protein
MAISNIIHEAAIEGSRKRDEIRRLMRYTRDTRGRRRRNINFIKVPVIIY